MGSSPTWRSTSTGSRSSGSIPSRGRNPGVLVRHQPSALASLLRSFSVEDRTMVSAQLDDGQELLGLNEVYFGHITHQSARYVVSTPSGERERHSSSGVVVGTGAGATGWCSSIARQRADAPELPDPVEAALCWFVREA